MGDDGPDMSAPRYIPIDAAADLASESRSLIKGIAPFPLAR